MILAMVPCSFAADIVLPDDPMTCGSKPSPAHIYNISHHYACSPNRTALNQSLPQDMTLQVDKQNIVEWQAKAYQCAKYRLSKLASRSSLM